MFLWSIASVICALIAVALGFTRVAEGSAASFAYFLFVLFIISFIMSLFADKEVVPAVSDRH